MQNKMAEEYSPRLLYESSSITPHGHEFWFVNHNPSQRVYVSVTPTTDSNDSLAERINTLFPRPSHEDEECSVPVDNDKLSDLRESLSPHLTDKTKNRLGFTLHNDEWTHHPPPSLSENAVHSPPDSIPELHLSQVVMLETREIRPNVRVARLEGSGQRCVFKNGEYSREAVGLSFEVSNYKSLIGKGCGGWIPKLLALVYTEDEEEGGGEKHFIGAAFEFFPQKDLTAHYATASTIIKTSWTVQLLKAIAALEEAGFEHWDLKCENVVLDTTPATTDAGKRHGSISHHPTDDDPGRIKIIDLENSKASSAWKVGEKEISMVYSMGKTVLEMFEGRVPDVGEVKAAELEKLPELARTVIRMCCCGGEDEVPTAKEVLEKVEGMGLR